MSILWMRRGPGAHLDIRVGLFLVFWPHGTQSLWTFLNPSSLHASLHFKACLGYMLSAALMTLSTGASQNWKGKSLSLRCLFTSSWSARAVASGWETGFQACSGPFMDLQVSHISLGFSFPTATEKEFHIPAAQRQTDQVSEAYGQVLQTSKNCRGASHLFTHLSSP